jgi:hypothetical protein
MNTTLFGGKLPMRATVLPLLAAVLFALGCSVDATKFTCSSSAECPTGYHCDMGTAAAAGTLKCASGSAQPKTLAANASKFLLSKQPFPDGSIRTTIGAGVGAVTSTPDFVGVRVVASQGGVDLADSQVAADGSVLEFQLPQALAQVSLRVQDDSGHSIPVTGYNQQVELSFVGRDVAGTSNPNAAYDVTAQSDSTYPPATWITSGPGPGGRASQFALTDTLLPDGGVQSSTSYSSIGYADYQTASSSSPGQLQDPSATSAGTPAGWQELSQIATSDNPDGGPPARVSTTLSNANGIVLYGGTDIAGTAADPAGTYWKFSLYTGWTPVVPPAGPNAVPTGGAKSSVALGYGGSTGCPGYPCTQQMTYDFSMAGGIMPNGFPTNRVVAYGTQSSFQTSTSPAVVTATGWFDIGLLPFANAGMSSAPAYIPISNSTTVNSFDNFAGMIMVGGQGVISGGVGLGNNDQNGCLLHAAAPLGSTVPFTPRSISCTDTTNWPTTTGAIGFRTGATLVPLDSQNFMLFGGLKQGGVSPGLKSDLWRGQLACNGPAGAACTTQVTWTQVFPTGTPPPPRANAGGAVWQTTYVFTPTFVVKRRVAFYGGADVAGSPLTDFWEYDINDNAWRQVSFDVGSALAPSARTRFAMVGENGSHAYVFGGNVSGAPNDQMWITTREAPARILVKAPFSLPVVDQATSSQLTLEAPGLIGGQAFLWDGTRWRFIGISDFAGGGYRLLKTPTAPATGFLQPDGNIYLLLVDASSRATPTFGGSPLSVDSVKMTVDFK